MLLALAVVSAAVSCSKADAFRQEDQYVGRSGPFVVSVFFSGSVTVFQDGAFVLQSHQAGVEGSYPELRIQGAGVCLDCSFQDPASFTASVVKDGGVGLPRSIRFVRDATVLDKNGDGILDETQGL